MCVCRLVTEEELLEVYGVSDAETRKKIMNIVEVAKEEYESDMDSSVSFLFFF